MANNDILTTSELQETIAQMLGDFQYEMKRVKAPKRKRHLEASYKFFKSVKYHLTTLELLQAKQNETNH